MVFNVKFLLHIIHKHNPLPYFLLTKSGAEEISY